MMRKFSDFTDKQIWGKNTLFAKYMGYKLVPCLSPFLGKMWRKENLNDSPLYNLLEGNEEKLLWFHKSYEWLLPVLDKIEKSGLKTVIDYSPNPHVKSEWYHWCEIGMKEYFAGSETTKLEAIYFAILGMLESMEEAEATRRI